MLIATTDSEYTKLISDNLSQYHADFIEVSDCSTLECLREAISKRRYDVALMDSEFIKQVDTSLIHMPVLLWSEDEDDSNIPVRVEKLRKHQRISSIVSSILERYAKVSKSRRGLDSRFASITAVWSPTGGVGKTTVALAYAASNVSEDKDVFYLNLENFSSVSGYFNENGKSISSVFEMLESSEGNIKMLVQGICCCDDGITYLSSPNNYDDMRILSGENINELVTACAELSDEVVVDLSCIYDERTKKVFEVADKVFIVTESTISAEAKLAQFTSQNNVFEGIQDKVVFIANKGATIRGVLAETQISLPLIESSDAIEVYKALAENNFNF